MAEATATAASMAARATAKRRLVLAAPPSERDERGVFSRSSPLGAGTAARALMRLGDRVALPFGGGDSSMAPASVDDYRQRLEAQDVAVVVLLLAAFALTLLVSFGVAHWAARDPSPVVFYSDTKYARAVPSRVVCTSADADAFLRAFNTQPQTARLRIIGRAGGEEEVGGFFCCGRLCCWVQRWLRWLSDFASRQRARQMPLQPPDDVAFDLSLDLTPFVAADGRLASDADAHLLHQHLSAQNPLEIIVLRKQVVWPNWEDVATNAKQTLRGLGFAGTVDVRLEGHEEIVVFRNNPWQNFVRSPASQALVLLSLVGAVVWIPYLWVRQRTVRVESHFSVNVDMKRYWDLLSLHPTNGYQFEGQ